MGTVRFAGHADVIRVEVGSIVAAGADAYVGETASGAVGVGSAGSAGLFELSIVVVGGQAVAEGACLTVGLCVASVHT